MSPLEGLLQAMQVQQQYPRADTRRLAREQQATQNRLKMIEQGWQQNPGRMPGGSGPTGLGRADKYGWSQMLNEQTEYQNLGNALTGKPQSVIQLGRSQPRGYGNVKALPESHDVFMRRYGR